MSEWKGARVRNLRTNERTDYESLAEALAELRYRGRSAGRFSSSFDMTRIAYEVSWGPDMDHDEAHYLVTPLPNA